MHIYYEEKCWQSHTFVFNYACIEFYNEHGYVLCIYLFVLDIDVT